MLDHDSVDRSFLVLYILTFKSSLFFNHLSLKIWILLPSPTCQKPCLSNKSLPSKMLAYAQSAKYLPLMTFAHKLFGLLASLQDCLAKSASFIILKSLNPRPPPFLPWVMLLQLTKCIPQWADLGMMKFVILLNGLMGLFFKEWPTSAGKNLHLGGCQFPFGPKVILKSAKGQESVKYLDEFDPEL